MQSNSFVYSMKIWLTSVVLSPLFYLIIEAYLKGNQRSGFDDFISNQITTYIMFVIFSGFFSFFTWVLFLCIVKVITLYFPSVQLAKCIIVAIGLLLTAGTFAVILPESFNIGDHFFYIMLANCICIASGSCFYKLEIAKEANVIVN
jgi:hypothetical protein